jgi:parallel beta-helix repeat protein
MKPLLTLFALAATLHAAPKADFFVSPSGNDKWSGTMPGGNRPGTDGPFRTLARARDAVRELRKRETPSKPVRVAVIGGRYELTEPLVFTPEDSGTEKSPTVFESIPGDNRPVILSGGVTLRKGGDVKDGKWVYPVDDDKPIRLISVKEEVRHRSRLPKEGYYTIAGLAGADPKGKYDTPANKFEFEPGEIDPKWRNLSDVEAVVLHFWVDTHLKVKDVDGDRRVVTFDRFSRRHFTDDYLNRLARYYLTNVFEGLGPGEFYLDRPSKTLYYVPKPGEDPRRSWVVVPKLDHVLSFDGGAEAGKFTEWVEFRGITVSDTTWEPPAGDAADGQAASNVRGAVLFRGARHCGFVEGTVRNVGGYGFEIADGCDHIRVVGNEVAHTGAGGVKLSGRGANAKDYHRTGDCQITDNHLHHLGEIFHSGVGILLMHADKNVIAHNEIDHLDYTGISVGWVWGYGPSVSKENRIEFNHIHDVGQKVLSDMGGVYLLGVSPGTVVRGNHIHDVDSWSYGGWGIYTDEGSTGITIENNLVYRTKSGGFHQHYGKDNVIRNNIFALAREGQLIRSREEDHTSFTFERNVVYWREGPLFGSTWKNDHFVVNHNVYWNAAGKPVSFPGGDLAQWRKRGHDTDSIIADPKFKDPAKGDFSFADESVVRKVGFVPFDVSKAGVRPTGKRD